MHVGAWTAAYRANNLPFSGQTVILKRVIEQTVSLLVNLVTRTLPKNRLCLRQIVHSKRTVSLGRCVCPQLTHFNTASVHERNVIWKVTQQQHCGVHRTVSRRFESRLKRNRPTTGPAPVMEPVDAPDERTTAITAINDASETGKRKNEEVEEEPGKRSRGKRRRGGGGNKQRPGERYIPPPQKRNQGVSFSQEHFDETSYYFEGGLRKVHPYYYDFQTYCKGRWIGKSLLEVFSSEFRSESIEYYEKAAKEGRIRLNETRVEDLSIVLRSNDHMRNTVHRHEPPVVGTPLDVLVDDGEVLVVNKPASMPVHPCGRFRHNTVIFILGKERGITELHTVHRLDRLTSGVLLFARTLEVSKKLDQLVRDRQLEKEYVCRVEGEFPEGKLVCEEPILVVSFKVGLCRVDPKGKECRTVFQRLSFNGSTSVVRCMPLTGRTHQIRVHLQYLGYPIPNDPIYGSSAWGPHRGKGGLVGKSDEELLKALMEEHRSKESLHLLDMPDDGLGVVQEEGSSAGAEANRKEEKIDKIDSASKPDENDVCSASRKPQEWVQQDSKCSSSDSIVSEVKQVTSQCTSSTEVHHTQDVNCSSDSPRESKCHVPTESNGNQTEATGSFKLAAPGTRDPLCSECKLVRPDPTAEELIMYLHALRYKGPDFEYSTRLPDWAKEDWVEDKFF